MSYASSDLRSQLGGSTRAAGVNVAPQPFEFDHLEPDERTPAGSSLWWVRSQAVVYNHVRAAAGDPIRRAGQHDEYAVLLPDGGVVRVEANGESVSVEGRAVVFVPAGDSEIVADRPATIIRLFAAANAPDLCAVCSNAAFYETPDPNVAEFAAWPDPPGGPRIRAYPIEAIERSPDRFGRLLRCSTFMINWFYPEPGPRDPRLMSPHHHDDFEQLSLQLQGDYVHHIRTAWVPDMTQWRDDIHVRCGSPSVTVIPPPAIHTSQSIGDEVHELVDIFCPPRADFSARPGWVVNADEYPAP